MKQIFDCLRDGLNEMGSVPLFGISHVSIDRVNDLIDKTEADCNAYEQEIRSKAIDEFCEDIKQYIAYEYGLTDVVLKEIEEIAERLKKEGAV